MATDVKTDVGTGGAAVSRLPALTGMRMFAALSVFILHCSIQPVFLNENLQLMFLIFASNLGYWGVGFFFLLSGFVLTWTARSSDTTTAFWRRRFFKIVPNHVVAYFFSLALLLAFGEAVTADRALANLFLYQAWIPDMLQIFANVNGPAWSLSVELIFYLSFPLLIIPISRIRPERLWRWAVGAVAVVLLLPVLSYNLLPSEPNWPLGPVSFLQVWAVYLLPVSRLFEFALGMIVCRMVANGKWFKMRIRWVVPIVVVGYLASLFVPDLFKPAAANLIPLVLLLGAVATSDIKGRKTILASRPMVFLGEISFAFYLLHYSILDYGHRLFGVVPEPFLGGYVGKPMSTGAGLLFYLGAFLVTLLLSWALYRGVELPIMRRWAKARRAPAPAPVPPSTLDETGDKELVNV